MKHEHERSLCLVLDHYYVFKFRDRVWRHNIEILAQLERTLLVTSRSFWTKKKGALPGKLQVTFVYRVH